MSNYRRNYVLGRTYVFTVNLLERKKTLLVDHIDELIMLFVKQKLNDLFILTLGLFFLIICIVFGHYQKMMPNKWTPINFSPVRQTVLAGAELLYIINTSPFRLHKLKEQ